MLIQRVVEDIKKYFIGLLIVFFPIGLIFLACITPPQNAIAFKASLPTTLSSHTFPERSLVFEPNVGQAGMAVTHIARTRDITYYFTNTGVSLAFRSAASPIKSLNDVPAGHIMTQDPVNEQVVMPATMSFIGSDKSEHPNETEQLANSTNYYLGSGQDNWHHNLPTFRNLEYAELYNGIDLVYDGTYDQLKGTFEVAPYASVAQIRWKYSGIHGLKVSPTGDLLIELGAENGATLIDKAPIAWQVVCGRKVYVTARYIVDLDMSVRFNIGSYDRTSPLIIVSCPSCSGWP